MTFFFIHYIVTAIIFHFGACLALETNKSVTYWHNWVDINGTSHITQCFFTNFTSNNVTGSNTPLFSNDLGSSSNIIISTVPVGFVQSWHVNPVPQLIYILSGYGKFEAMDGTHVVLTPGVIYFGNDQMATKGHETYNLGNQSLVMSLVQFDEWNNTNPATQYRPCWLH